MKGDKSKYLIIDANNIVKQLYRVEREFAFNDFDNIYYKDGITNGIESFAKNSIPKKFQKIIIKVNTPFMLKEKIEEYITGFPFKIEDVEVIDGKTYVRIVNVPVYHDSQMFKDELAFKTRLVYSSLVEVKEFLRSMREEGYLEPYLQSLDNLFKVSITSCIRKNGSYHMCSYGSKNA